MLAGKYRTLYNHLLEILPEDRILHDDLRTLAFGTDASFYRLIPQIVIKAESEPEIIQIIKKCRDLAIPLTFRAAATSLSGQAISDSVLVLATRGWKKHRINGDASEISLQPGIIGAHANQILAPYNKKIGPDPASINAAMIGGIAANNASGMCCGTAQNSYQTLAGMRMIFSDGSVLDTRDGSSVASFKNLHPEIISALVSLSERVKNNAPLAERIHRKYKMKNTTGYSLNALVDFSDPIDMIQHLMIGSEGTLGFIAEITYKTVPEFPHKATALMLFPDIENACKAVSQLKSAPVAAVELMDRAALRSVENQDGMPRYLKTLNEPVAALLVETGAPERKALEQQMQQVQDAIQNIPTELAIHFTDDSVEFTKLWKIRKGLFPSVGAMRKTGTTVIIEDVAFPVPRLAEATLELQDLFQKHGYNDAIIFGHALEGNLHFVFKQDFNLPQEVKRYKNFIDDICRMVVAKYDGSLKAEHGTGRNMAPFVELEWGQEAYQLMHEIKQIFDKDNLLNPGVILNADAQIHLKSLKPLPAGNKIIDKCIECGFCEPDCVSRDLTLSPRQRIVVYREIARLTATGTKPHRLAQLRRGFDYQGNQTCATDGLCALGCPVEINTGTLIKEIRQMAHTKGANKLASLIGDHIAQVSAIMKVGLNLADYVHKGIGTRMMTRTTGFFRKILRNRLPQWNPYLPRAANRILMTPIQTDDPHQVVYLPSCINRTMGISRDYDTGISLTSKTHQLLQKAGFSVIYPDNLPNLCCGMAFSSKGFNEIAQKKAAELKVALLKASQDGRFPIYVDMSPCLYHLKETWQNNLQLYEPIEFILKFLADKLCFHTLPETIAIHTTCSARKMGLEDKFKKLAQLCAEQVIVPEGPCCGFAGDRGFTYPELNRAGLVRLKEQLPDNCHQGFSTSRTCEIGLTWHSGISYKSIVYLVDRCTTPKRQ